MDLGSTTSGIGGFVAVLNLIFLLIGVVIAWFALQAVRWDLFLKNPKGKQAAVLRILLSIAIGYQLTRFLNDYLMATQMIH